MENLTPPTGHQAGTHGWRSRFHRLRPKAPSRQPGIWWRSKKL